MAKAKGPNVPISERRGVFGGGSGDSWFMTLVQMPGRTGPIDLDELVDRLLERRVIGSARRDVGAELHAGRVATPSGKWALLVALPGQPWAYLLPGFESYALPDEIARQAGLRVIGTGHQDTANATSFGCREGEENLVTFATSGQIDEVVAVYDDPDDWETKTLFAGSRLPGDWIGSYRSEADALQALVKEFDAYLPSMKAANVKGVVKVHGFDRQRFKPEDYLRIDLIGFGDARLEPSDADKRLRQAIAAGDVEAARAAVAAGADLHRPLLGHDETALHVALKSNAPSRRAMVAALLELGAEAHPPGHEQPVYLVLDRSSDYEDELVDLLELLTARGAEITGRGLRPGTQSRSPLHVATGNRWRAVAKFLIAHGADVRATNSNGLTPRQVAEADAQRMREFIGEAKAAEYDEILAFLKNAEAGRAELDWRADADESSRRERRRREDTRREFRERGDPIQEMMKAAGLFKRRGQEPTGE